MITHFTTRFGNGANVGFWHASPYRGENSGPGKDDHGELDTETRN
jgi:hypothetical protein